MVRQDIPCENKQKHIPEYDSARAIYHPYPVSISIDTNAQVKIVLPHLFDEVSHILKDGRVRDMVRK